MLRVASAQRVFGVLVCMLLLVPTLSVSFDLTLGTGSRDTFSYFAGKLVCRAIHKQDASVSCQVISSDNFTDNLTNLQNGSLDLALTNSKIIYDAFHGEGVFQFVSLDYSQLRLLMPLYRTPIILVARRDSRIDAFTSLKGKKVNGGMPFSLQEIVFDELMEAEGWDESSFSLYQNLSAANVQDLIALHTGSVQAMLHIGMHPDRKLANSLANKQTRLVAVQGEGADSLLEFNSGFSEGKLTSNMYKALTEDMKTLALETQLITSADTDSETVELVLDAIVEAKRQLRNAHPSLLKERVDIETLNASYLHPHPEAVIFFQANQSRL
jgi:TRAP transporter TAXI family solute receptor